MSPFERSLATLIAAAPEGCDDWWLIGSAAAHLSGIDLEPQDVDVFGGRATIERFLANLGVVTQAGSQSDRFRSTPFQSLSVENGLPLEFMGDLHVRDGDEWHPLRLTTRVSVNTPYGRVYMPSLAEQKAVFELFGRPKDLAKAAMIR